jgi:phosphomannomutase
MSTPPITFGTDGWRAVIADGYTFANLERVTQATAQWLNDEYGPNPTIVLGHDTRFLGREFAEHAARLMAHAGVHVTLSETFVPTPAISWATEAMGCDAGVVITASLNPPRYNGFKIKAHFGGPAPPAMIREVERRVPDGPVDTQGMPSFDALRGAGHIEIRDIGAAYLEALRQRLDIEAIRASGLTVAHDPMFGAGKGLVADLLGESRVVELHNDWNPSFHGRPPEPIERNLSELSETIRREGCDVGLANDGDADRIGMFDETGTFVSSHRLLALLVKYLYEERGFSGKIVKTFSTTHMLDKMAEQYGLEIETTPIGFKYIAPKMAEEDVLVGGEESGGIAAKGHIPERDGIYIGLLITEMVVKRGKPLSALVQELFDEFGPHRTYRDDLHITAEQKASVLHRLERQGGLDQILGHDVERLDTLDGFKHITEAGWLLIRPSGTEPVLRVYSEAETAETAEALVKDATQQLGLDGAAH